MLLEIEVKNLMDIEDYLGLIGARVDRLQAIIQAFVDFTGADMEELKMYDIQHNQDYFIQLFGIIEEYAGMVRAEVKQLEEKASAYRIATRH